jgi:hypothetical protein
MTEPKRPPTAEETFAGEMLHQTTLVTDLLRHTADRIDRVAKGAENVGKPGLPSYASVVASIQNEIRAMLGNLMVDSIIVPAAQADQARQRSVAATEIANRITTRAGLTREESWTPATGVALGAVVEIGAQIAREYAVEEG